MGYLSITKVSASGAVEKYLPFEKQAEAVAHVASMVGQFPKAFAAPDPGGSFRDWTADPVAKTVVYAPKPVDRNIAIRKQIQTLEQSVTQRRLREAIRTAPGKQWLETVDDQIVALRGQLQP